MLKAARFALLALTAFSADRCRNGVRAAAHADRVLRRPDLPLVCRPDRQSSARVRRRRIDHPHDRDLGGDRADAPGRRVERRRPRLQARTTSTSSCSARARVRAARDDQHHRHARSGRTATRRRTSCRRRSPTCRRSLDMLAVRYNGAQGKGYVGLWSVWNEPNLQQFLTPQYVGKKIVSPANYAKLYKAAYAGIKSGNRAAQVAIGETSAQGRDKPSAGSSQTVSPGMFAKLLSQQKGLQVRRVGAPSVSDRAEREADREGALPERDALDDAEVREGPAQVVPSHGADLDHRVRPRDEAGRAARRHDGHAGGVREAGARDREEGPERADVHLVHVPRQLGQPVAERPAAAVRVPRSRRTRRSARSRVRPTALTTNVRAGQAPTVTLYFPFLAYYNSAGTTCGMTYKDLRWQRSRRGRPAGRAAAGKPVARLPGVVHAGEEAHVHDHRDRERPERPHRDGRRAADGDLAVSGPAGSGRRDRSPA